MSLRILKEHLPWVAPTAAIVLAATGFIDLSPRESDSAQGVGTSGYSDIAVTRNVSPDPVAAVRQATGIQPLASGGATALPATVVQPQVQAIPQVQQPVTPQPAVVAPQPAPVIQPTPQPVSITPEPSVNPIDDPNGFFGSAQAKLAQDRSCVEDLRALARDAKIYFPSGGLTGEESGLAQGRLIGLVAQECSNVEIIVEGHSDPSGNPNANLRLSQRRAEAVLQRIGAAGIDVSKFRAVGIGSRDPSGIRGPRGNAYYDRRVEFQIRELSQSAGFTSTVRTTSSGISSCALRLQAAVAQTKLFFSPRSITASAEDLPSVVQLASAASNCPDARLRVIGQYSDDIGSGESPATGRLRAVALMNALVASGFDSEQIIIAAPSKPTQLAGQPGLSERRIDFDMILEN